ncbi:hypothetical protein BD309DRAFT_995537 [Dichomitus squalens]|nr:hypothetical protein BD309DRAFT_995537 [Dichomitus squalens]
MPIPSQPIANSSTSHDLSGTPGWCQGCRTQFSQSGLSKHLSQTKKVSCVAFLNLRNAAIVITGHAQAESSAQAADKEAALDPELDAAPHSLPADVDMDAPPIPFEGDFFGDYPDTFFNQEDDGGTESSDLSTDDEEEPELEPEPEPGRHDISLFPNTEQQIAIEHRVRRNTFTVSYPSQDAGAPIPNVQPTSSAHYLYRNALHTGEHSSDENVYYPFSSAREWWVSHWAKTRGPGSTAFDDLMAIKEVAERLALLFKNSRGMNAIIDKKIPPARPIFECHEIIVAGEAFEVFYRDILACIQTLFGDPAFAPILLLRPERHYTDEDQTVRVYFDMNTGKWWWATQKQLEQQKPGATVVPVIISSDKTQLTLFGNKTAYPVYMTIGNLPKDVRCKPSRRGQILLAYLSTSRLLHITNKAAHRRTLTNLFHACMSRILAPLANAGVDGIQLVSGDGLIRRGHPILATYIGDYPEQVLVTGCKTGECPKCPISQDDVGRTSEPSRPLRDLGTVLDALAAIEDGPRAFIQACRQAGIKPLFHPFWESLPYTNIFLSITPDILHQLYQGVVKHLLAWLQEAYGTEEIDARCRLMPQNNGLRHFAKGISHMSHVTGKEHQDISRILLGLIIGLPLPGGLSSARLVCATCALLDFLYLAQYPTHTDETLDLLEARLQAFHANKSIFIDLGVRTNFELPKLHSLDHYHRSIELFGTTDNYDTQYSERLHIDFAKDAYRATNKKDELVQMTVWLERKEKILRHGQYIEWRLEQLHTGPATPSLQTADILSAPLRIQMLRHPSAKAVKLDDLSKSYGATYFHDALARFVVKFNKPTLTRSEVEHESAGIFFPFRAVPTFHKIKFALPDPDGLATPETTTRDVIHARTTRNKKGRGVISSRFDTALIREPRDLESETQHDAQAPLAHPPYNVQSLPVAYQVVRVRVVFKIPPRGLEELFPRIAPDRRPQHLAYVELFTPLTISDPNHGLYKVNSKVNREGDRLAMVIPIDNIERSCHLIPDFGPIAPREWTSATVLDACNTFYLNTFADRNTYKLIH